MFKIIIQENFPETKKTYVYLYIEHAQVNSKI